MLWFSSTIRKILLRACCPPWDSDSDSDSDSENRDIETGLCFRGTGLLEPISTESLEYLRLQLDNHMIDCKTNNAMLVSSHYPDEKVKLWTDICRTVDYAVCEIYNDVCIHNNTKVTALQLANVLPEVYNGHILHLLDTCTVFPDMYNTIYIRDLIKSFESRDAVKNKDYVFVR
jgi:hypothetical protein